MIRLGAPRRQEQLPSNSMQTTLQSLDSDAGDHVLPPPPSHARRGRDTASSQKCGRQPRDRTRRSHQCGLGRYICASEMSTWGARDGSRAQRRTQQHNRPDRRRRDMSRREGEQHTRHTSVNRGPQECRRPTTRADEPGCNGEHPTDDQHDRREEQVRAASAQHATSGTGPQEHQPGPCTRRPRRLPPGARLGLGTEFDRNRMARRTGPPSDVGRIGVCKRFTECMNPDGMYVRLLPKEPNTQEFRLLRPTFIVPSAQNVESLVLLDLESPHDDGGRQGGQPEPNMLGFQKRPSVLRNSCVPQQSHLEDDSKGGDGGDRADRFRTRIRLCAT